MTIAHNNTHIRTSPIAATTDIHWGLMTHICVSKLTCIGSDNENEILTEIHADSFKKCIWMQCILSSLLRSIIKWIWIPAYNETNLWANTHWKVNFIRETTWLTNGLKPKMTKASSSWQAFCFNDCGKTIMWVYQAFHCPTFSVNWLWSSAFEAYCCLATGQSI